jgi:hypothetical protein
LIFGGFLAYQSFEFSVEDLEVVVFAVLNVNGDYGTA